MFKFILIFITNRQYNLIDAFIFALFSAMIVLDRWWTGFFVIMAGSIISGILEAVVKNLMTPVVKARQAGYTEAFKIKSIHHSNDRRDVLVKPNTDLNDWFLAYDFKSERVRWIAGWAYEVEGEPVTKKPPSVTK